MKITISFVGYCILFILSGCSDDVNKVEIDDMHYRTIAYNSISDEEKADVVGDWQDAEIIAGIFKHDVCNYEFIQENQGRICFFPHDDELEMTDNQPLFAVIFNTINDSLLGPIIVIIDPNQDSAVGFAARL